MFVATAPEGSYAAQMRHQQAPLFIEPMLLATGIDLPTGDDWWAELKLDGARGQLRIADGTASLRTHRGRRCDAEFPEIVTAAADRMPDIVLDGEIVLPGEDGAPDFSALRTRLGASAGRARAAADRRPAVFYAFDALWHAGTDLRAQALAARRELLDSLPLAGSLALVEAYAGEPHRCLPLLATTNLRASSSNAPTPATAPAGPQPGRSSKFATANSYGSRRGGLAAPVS
jgi:ATP-dependent DNA ligase